MRDLVKTGFDVALQHPVISTGAVVMDLGDRVVCAPVGAEPIRARLEIRLEDRFEYCFQAGLDHAVRDGWYTELAEFPVRFRYNHLPHFDRPEPARFQRVPDLAQESLDPDPGFRPEPPWPCRLLESWRPCWQTRAPTRAPGTP